MLYARTSRKKSLGWRTSTQRDTMTAEYDVIIIGAGPAGLMAAETIMKGDPSKTIMIIDRYADNYNKPCGGGVPKQCLEEYPFLVEIANHKTTELVAVYKEHRRTFHVEITMIPRAVMRITMLKRLNHPNVSVMLNSIVTSIDVDEKEITINNKFTMKYTHLIGADGVNSIVAKTINFKYPKVPLIVTANKSRGHIQRGIRSEIIFLEDLPAGYFWTFPKGNNVNIGIGGNVKGRKLKEMFDYYFRLFGYAEYQQISRSAHLIPSEYKYNLFHLPTTILTRQIILCGDAATFVNPMTGEGIYYALRSGQEAAEVILGTRRPVDYPSFHTYLARVQQLRDEVKNLPMRETFERIFVDKETSGSTVNFLFSHSIPNPKKFSDTEKKNIYDKL